MNRKKFFTIISTSFLGIAFLKLNPIKFFDSRKNSADENKIRVKLNPLSVSREKSGKKNG